MKNTETTPELERTVQAIREEVVMGTLAVGIIGGTVMYLGNLWRNIVLGNPMSYMHTVLLAAVLMVYVQRRRIGADRIAWMLVITLYLAAIGGQALYGIFSNSGYLMMGMCFMAASFFGMRGGIIAAVICVATLSTMGLLTVNGQVPMRFDPVTFYYSPLSWVAAVTTLAAMSGIVLVQTSRMQMRLITLVRQQHHQAHHDALTGLPNRSALETRLQQSLAEAQRDGQTLALLFLDLDHFKHINDSLGHQVGDLLLMEVARRLTGTVRAADTVARLGGDEFVLVLPRLAAPEDATTLACKIIEVLGRTYTLGEHQVATSASIGISLFPQDGEDVGALMKGADTAMYHAKAMGRGGFQYFAPEMNRHAVKRLNIERQLRDAIQFNQFVVHYQPQVDMSGHVTGLEALIRWHQPGEGLQLPAVFITIAEETDLINDIGDWVLVHVCQQIRAWREAGITVPRIAVNLSARQLRQRALPAQVGKTLTQHGVPAHLIELEVTESAAMENPGLAAQILGELGSLGITLTIDDFGTGYSSLSYLKSLPIDSLKIDRSFVLDITHDSNDLAIAHGTIALAHSLGLRVIAEGVETTAQRDLLRESNCDEIQGYLIARPMPADELITFLSSQPALPPG